MKNEIQKLALKSLAFTLLITLFSCGKDYNETINPTNDDLANEVEKILANCKLTSPIELTFDEENTSAQNNILTNVNNNKDLQVEITKLNYPNQVAEYMDARSLLRGEIEIDVRTNSSGNFSHIKNPYLPYTIYKTTKGDNKLTMLMEGNTLLSIELKGLKSNLCVTEAQLQ